MTDQREQCVRCGIGRLGRGHPGELTCYRCGHVAYQSGPSRPTRDERAVLDGWRREASLRGVRRE